MRIPRIPCLVLLLPLVAAEPARAWTAPTRMRMVDEAVRLMPPSLRVALERQREHLIRGALEPMIAEDSKAHRPPWHGGDLDAAIVARMDALTLAAAEMKSFRDVARRFGELAHFVADAAFPPGAAGEPGVARYQDFAKYCESRLDRIPLVFWGHDDLPIAADGPRAFATEVLRQARAEDQDLARAYSMAGDPPDPAAFDDRSVPFAVASLSYTRSVTSIVRAWLGAWGKASGDLRETPYLKSVDVYRRPQESP